MANIKALLNRICQRAFRVGCMLLLFTAGVTAHAQNASDEIIVESITTTTMGRYKEMSGKWIDSWAKSALPGLTPKSAAPTRKYVFHNPFGEPTPGDASARFYPDVPAKGRYFVYVTWPEWGNASPVRYTVSHNSGKAVKLLKQDGFAFSGLSNAHAWVLLGEYDFKSGDEQYVEVAVDPKAKPAHPDKHGQVFADAICLRKTLMPENVLDPALASVDGASSSNASAVAATNQPAAVTAAEQAKAPAVPRPIQWVTDMRKAREAAERDKKELLIFFDGPEASLSQHYDSKVFTEATVQGALSNFVLLRLSHKENLQLATQLQVFRPGVILIYDNAGNGIDKIADRLSPNEFIARVRNH